MKTKTLALAVALGIVLYIQFCVDLKDVIQMPAGQVEGP